MNRFCRGILFVVLLSVVSCLPALSLSNGLVVEPSFAQTPTVNIVGPTVVTPAVPGISIPNASGGATTIYPGSQKVDVNAHVGEFKVSVAGLASPNASVILKDEKG